MDNIPAHYLGAQPIPQCLRFGTTLWTHRRPTGVVSWGIAVDRHGRVLVTLCGRRVVCFAAKG